MTLQASAYEHKMSLERVVEKLKDVESFFSPVNSQTLELVKAYFADWKSSGESVFKTYFSRGYSIIISLTVERVTPSKLMMYA